MLQVIQVCKQISYEVYHPYINNESLIKNNESYCSILFQYIFEAKTDIIQKIMVLQWEQLLPPLLPIKETKKLFLIPVFSIISIFYLKF
jgi:hypothetical protein